MKRPYQTPRNTNPKKRKRTNVRSLFAVFNDSNPFFKKSLTDCGQRHIAVEPLSLTSLSAFRMFQVMRLGSGLIPRRKGKTTEYRLKRSRWMSIRSSAFPRTRKPHKGLVVKVGVVY